MADIDAHVERINDVLLKYVKCIHCSEFCLPPIHQCGKGHIFCDRCSKEAPIQPPGPNLLDNLTQKQKCWFCTASLTPTRNRVAEKVSQEVKFPCKFADKGCEAKFNRDSMPDHMRTCPYAIRCQLRNYHSPNSSRYDLCAWTGRENELYQHVKEAHRGFGKNSETVTHKFSISSGTDSLLAQCFARQFWSYLIFDFNTYSVRGMVFFIGTNDEAKRFGFEYEVLRRDCPRPIVVKGDVVCMRWLNADLKEYFKAGKPSVVLFEGRDAFNQIHDLGVFPAKMTVVKKRF